MAQTKYGDTVKVHYTGKLEDGTIFDTSVTHAPIQLTIGKGQLLPAFENAIVGMSPGESKTVKIHANSAYGPYRKEMTQTIARDRFPNHLKPQVGQVLQDHQPDGQIVKVMVTDVSESNVKLDANHPLAGKNLIFDIQFVGFV